MSQFSYSFCLSLFHSIWQCALLLIFYSAIQPFVKRQLPSFKRNILYGLLFTQVGMSIVTFLIYSSGSLNFYKDGLTHNFSSLLVKQPFIEKLCPWIISMYTTVIFFKTIQLIYNWYRFKAVCKSTLIKPSIDLKLFTLKKAMEFGIGRKVTLWFSKAVSTPLTFGFWKPVLLMPVALLNRLSVAEAESLIIHELTHIKNNDYLLNWLLVVTETLFFYNPFIKIIAQKIKLEREKNCDVQVLQYQYHVVTYAETLLKTAKFKTNINYFPLAAVFKNKQLLQRIRFFTSAGNLSFSKKNRSAFSFSVIISALLINFFILLQVKNYTSSNNSNKIIAAIPQFVSLAEDDIPAITDVPNHLAIAIPASKKSSDAQVKGLDQAVKKMSMRMEQFEKTISRPETKNIQVGYAVPVVNIQSEEKEMIVQEESSGINEAVTKAYKVKLKNGKWHDELVFVLKERKPSLADSICQLTDSLPVRYIPVMQ